MPIVGETAKTYRAATGDVGSRLRAVVTAENDLGTASAASVPTAVIPALPGTVPPGTGTVPPGTGAVPPGTGVAPLGTGTAPAQPQAPATQPQAPAVRSFAARAVFRLPPNQRWFRPAAGCGSPT